MHLRTGIFQSLSFTDIKTTFSILSNKNKRKTNVRKMRKTQTMMYTEGDVITSNDEPPTSSTNEPKMGSYCLRATTELVNTANPSENAISRTYVGYDEYTTIVQKVQGICNRDSETFGKDTHACKDTKLAFMGHMPDCNGRVEVTDHVNITEFTLY